MKEWRPIPGYGDKYQVHRKTAMIIRTGGHMVKASGSPPRVRLYKLGTEFRPYVHSIMKKVWNV